jgi:hypothetical protein
MIAATCCRQAVAASPEKKEGPVRNGAFLVMASTILPRSLARKKLHARYQGLEGVP